MTNTCQGTGVARQFESCRTVEW